MKNLYSLPLEKLEQEMIKLGENKYRAKQLYSCIYEK